jgi:PIN domain nuclease of toxin-antitoxin system
LAPASARGDLIGISAISLLEIALLSRDGKLKDSADEIFKLMQTNAAFEILPLTYGYFN